MKSYNAHSHDCHWRHMYIVACGQYRYVTHSSDVSDASSLIEHGCTTFVTLINDKDNIIFLSCDCKENSNTKHGMKPHETIVERHNTILVYQDCLHREQSHKVKYVMINLGLTKVPMENSTYYYLINVHFVSFTACIVDQIVAD
jgi:hypothetical protein